MQIRVGQIDRDLSHSRNVSDMVFLVEFHMSSHGLFDAAAVGQAGGPLVVEFVVRGEVEAGGNAGTGEHLVLVPDRDNVSVFFHEHGGVHELKAHGEGEIIIDFEGEVGVQ